MTVNLKSVAKLLLYGFTTILVKKVPVIPKTVLIVRVEGFGDYILFRNYLYWLKSRKEFAGYYFTLVGNVLWKEFAEHFDHSVVERFIWINHSNFGKNFLYRVKKIREICESGYEVVIYPTYLRETLYGDSIIRAATSNYKIGSTGEIKYRSLIETHITNLAYSSLIPASKDVMFEFDRLNEFFCNWLHSQVEVGMQLIYDEKRIYEDKYVVFFVGASSNNRKWSIHYFNALAAKIFDKLNIKIILCGALADKHSINQEPDLLNKSYVINMVGKTSQLELINWLKYAEFVVSNETVVPHLCVVLGTPVFALYNGNNFGKFTPYPKHITTKYYAINHPAIESNQEHYRKISNENNYITKLSMHDITVKQVYEIIKQKYIDSVL